MRGGMMPGGLHWFGKASWESGVSNVLRRPPQMQESSIGEHNLRCLSAKGECRFQRQPRRTVGIKVKDCWRLEQHASSEERHTVTAVDTP